LTKNKKRGILNV